MYLCLAVCVCLRACYTSPIGSCDKGYNDSVDVGSDYVRSTLSARIVLASACKTETKSADSRLKLDRPPAPASKQTWLAKCMYFSHEYLYHSNIEHRNNNLMCVILLCFVCVVCFVCVCVCVYGVFCVCVCVMGGVCMVLCVCVCVCVWCVVFCVCVVCYVCGVFCVCVVCFVCVMCFVCGVCVLCVGGGCGVFCVCVFVIVCVVCFVCVTHE